MSGPGGGRSGEAGRGLTLVGVPGAEGQEEDLGSAPGGKRRGTSPQVLAFSVVPGMEVPLEVDLGKAGRWTRRS